MLRSYQFSMSYWYPKKMKMRLIMVNISIYLTSEAVVQRCSVKKVFLEISQNSLENPFAKVSFLVKKSLFILLKKRLWHKCFSLNFTKFLRTPLVAASVTYQNTLINFMVTLFIRCKLKWAISSKYQLHLQLPRFQNFDF